MEFISKFLHFSLLNIKQNVSVRNDVDNRETSQCDNDANLLTSHMGLCSKGHNHENLLKTFPGWQNYPSFLFEQHESNSPFHDGKIIK